MQPPTPFGPQIVIDSLTDQQMRERDRPAGRRVLLNQWPRCWPRGLLLRLRDA